MAKVDSPTSLRPPSEIVRQGKSLILYADDNDAFRVACASEAVAQASVLLGVLDREFNPEEQSDRGFCVIFETTMRRVKELLDSVNIGPSNDSIVEDDQIANVVFGEEVWLIGERLADGRVVVAGSTEACHG